MSDFNQFQYRIDKLVLFYMEKTCDISSMTVEEYIKKFEEISDKVLKAFDYQ